MTLAALQGVGLNYGWPLKDDAWKPGMDADLVIANGLLGNRIQAVVNAEPSVAVAPDITNAGKGWIVGTSPGAWAVGKADHIAFRNGETASWIFIAPHRAFGLFLNLATGDFMEYSGTAWVTTYTEPSSPVPSTGFYLQSLTATPPTPVSPGDDGKCWGVDVGATGDWAGQDGKMAMWYVPPAGSTGQWRFIQPSQGWRALSDAVPFADEFGVYGYSVYRDFYVHDGTIWILDPLLRLARGPITSLNLSVAPAATPWVRVLTLSEASASVLALSGTPADAEITIRFPQSALPVTPASIVASRIFGDLTAKITVDWGDGTEVPGTIGDAGDPGTGATSGSGTVNLLEGVPETILPLNPALGMNSAISAALESTTKNAERLPHTMLFVAGVRDLDVPPEAGSAAIRGYGDVARLLISDEVAANTLRIATNPLKFNSVSGNTETLLFRVAQKGAGATTIVLDNTVTGTNNLNDVLDAIAPATMSQGESRTLRLVKDGGTGGLGHRWIITHS
jgi:hypothetical protein